MSDDVPLFIKRRMLAIKDAIEHAMLPTCVVQPEEYDDDLGYANDVFNAVLDELAWDTYKDGLTPEQEDELYNYLREYYLDAVVDYYHSCVDEDDEDLFESEDEIISKQTNIDKTKPVDFYFGNRVFRASDYQMALEFARKLAIKNFNSNMIKIYEHPDNERWFVGQNDKIYLNKNRYDEDPNKNVYIDPVKMGLSAL